MCGLVVKPLVLSLTGELCPENTSLALFALSNRTHNTNLSSSAFTLKTIPIWQELNQTQTPTSEIARDLKLSPRALFVLSVIDADLPNLGNYSIKENSGAGSLN